MPFVKSNRVYWKIQKIILKVKEVFNGFHGEAYPKTKQRQGGCSKSYDPWECSL